MKTMLTSTQPTVAILLLAAGLLGWPSEAMAQQTKSNQLAKAHPLSPADDRVIREILKDQETASRRLP